MTDKALERRAREFAKFWCAKNGKNSRHVRIAFAVDFAKEVEQPRPKLEKVREFINGVSNAWLNSEGKAKKLQALAELDAFEKEGT